MEKKWDRMNIQLLSLVNLAIKNKSLDLNEIEQNLVSRFQLKLINVPENFHNFQKISKLFLMTLATQSGAGFKSYPGYHR